jgi:hypothetical protein
LRVGRRDADRAPFRSRVEALFLEQDLQFVERGRDARRKVLRPRGQHETALAAHQERIAK